MTIRCRRILIVEDESAAAATLADFLRSCGYEVSVADDGPAAIAACGSQTFDLVLTDVTMPALDGWQLASRLSQIRPELPIVLMSGHTGADVAARQTVLPVRALLMKPLDLREVLATVERALLA